MPASISHPQRTLRAAAVLTTSDVASEHISLPRSTPDGLITCLIVFTLGSLTNGIFTPQVSPDGTNWFDVTDPGALILTADARKALPVNCSGMRVARVLARGTGTASGSSAAISVSWKVPL